MQWSDIQFRPPERTLRQFAGLWLDAKDTHVRGF